MSVKNPIWQWELRTVNDIMLACIIMHNMIVEDEQGLGLKHIYNRPLEHGHKQKEFIYSNLEAKTREIEDVSSHFALRNNRIDHL